MLTSCAGVSGTVTTGAPSPTGQFVSVGTNRLHYQLMGDSGPKVIAIHGASGNLRDWALGPAQALATDHQVLLFDRPGFGFSDRARQNGSNLFVQAELMHDAARQLGFEGATLIGHSFGGSVALAWALSRPESIGGLMLLAAPSQVWQGGLGLLTTLTGTPVVGPLLSRILPAIASDDLVAGTVTRIFRPQTPPPGYVEAVGADLALRPEQIRNNSQDLKGLKDQVRKMVPRYPGIEMPVELLHGDADTTVPLKVHSVPLSGQLPNAKLTVLEGIGHMPHHAATAEMRAALLRLEVRR
ncbi:alpha/beta fold hydrolase [Algicella marina]|nr:alpha/beta hydrolase [Algicella marina]